MYVVIELQTTFADVTSTLVTTYDELPEAESKYHDILRYAAISTLKIHAASILTPEGRVIKNEAYSRPEEEVTND